MTPQTQCDRCYRLGPVKWDEEQGELCDGCTTHFETERAKGLDEKEQEQDRLYCHCQE